MPDTAKNLHAIYEAIVQNTPDLVYAFDLNYRFTYANEALLTMWGLSWDEAIGKTLLENGYEDWHAEMHEREIDTVVATKKLIRGEVSFPHAVLGRRIYDYIFAPIFNQHGEVAGIAGTTRDISEIRQAERKLQESESRFRNLVEQAPMSIALLRGKDYIVELANKMQLDIWDKPKEEVIGRPAFEAVPEGAGQGFEALLEKVYTTGEPFFGSRVPGTLTRNGKKEVFYYDFVLKALYAENNEVDGIMGVGFDVTEQVKATQKIVESEERFRSLAQSLPQLVWVTDVQGKSEFASNRWVEYSGVEPSSEAAWKEIVHPDDYEGINEAWKHSLETGEVYTYAVRLKSKEGEYRWHSVEGEPVYDEQHKLVKWVGAFTDIEEQKKKEERKDEFISIASHEMKTPLTTAKAYLQLLEMTLDENDEERKLYARNASESVNKLSDLINDLLDVNKIRLGKINYNITAFDFNQMMQETVKDIQLTTQTHRLVLSGSTVSAVTGDKNRLQQVVINLLTNAIKYSPNSTEIFVSLCEEDKMVKVTVRDTGMGISSLNLSRIFERYYRSDEHAVHYQGLGIGLFISQEIIKRHGGELWAESEPGKGSTFSFTVPANGFTTNENV